MRGETNIITAFFLYLLSVLKHLLTVLHLYTFSYLQKNIPGHFFHIHFTTHTYLLVNYTLNKSTNSLKLTRVNGSTFSANVFISFR